MTLFIFLLFLFSLFFTFDNKPINLLLDFLGIILSLSFFLLSNFNSFDFSFFSFIFIIIYGSALAILFAFILMLFNSNSSNAKLVNVITPSFSSFYPYKLILQFNFSSFSSYAIFRYASYAIFSFFILTLLFYFFFACEASLTHFLVEYSFSNNTFFHFNLISFLFSSFLFNFFPLILIINILLLGLIGAVFLLI